MYSQCTGVNWPAACIVSHFFVSNFLPSKLFSNWRRFLQSNAHTPVVEWILSPSLDHHRLGFAVSPESGAITIFALSSSRRHQTVFVTIHDDTKLFLRCAVWCCCRPGVGVMCRTTLQTDWHRLSDWLVALASPSPECFSRPMPNAYNDDGGDNAQAQQHDARAHEEEPPPVWCMNVHLAGIRIATLQMFEVGGSCHLIDYYYCNWAYRRQRAVILGFIVSSAVPMVSSRKS